MPLEDTWLDVQTGAQVPADQLEGKNVVNIKRPHFHPIDVCLYIGAARAGKSKAAAVRSVKYLIDNPKAVAVLGAENMPLLKRTLLKEWQDIFTDIAPWDHLKLQNRLLLRKNTQNDQRFIFANGSIANVIHFNDPAILRGIDADIIIFEESCLLPDRDAFDELVRRLSGKKGPVRQLILTTNPDKIGGWMSDVFKLKQKPKSDGSLAPIIDPCECHLCHLCLLKGNKIGYQDKDGNSCALQGSVCPNCNTVKENDCPGNQIWYRVIQTASTDNPHIPSDYAACFGKDTPILMYDGTVKPIQDIDMGDQVMGPDSKPRNVIDLHRGRDKLYKVIPNKGKSWICNENHILNLRFSGHDYGLKTGDILNIKVKDYLNKKKHFKQSCLLYKVPVTFDSREVKIDPYYLGYWLGDGSCRMPSITTMDKEVSDYVYEIAAKANLFVRRYDKKGSKASDFSITKSRFGSRHLNVFRENLKYYNLLKNKRIPKDYSINDKETRLQLLAGLIDSDGTYDGFQFEFAQKDHLLTAQVKELCQNLGFSIGHSIDKTKSEKGINRLTINGYLDQIPTKIARKKAKPRNTQVSHFVTRFTLEELGMGEYYGFSVLEPDQLFLLDDCTVVHNSMMKSMDPKTAAIFVQGRLDVELRESYVYSSFSMNNNVLDDNKDLDPAKPLFWALDFNFDPQCSVICQEVEENEEFFVHVADEIILWNSGPESVGKEFVRRL